MAQLERRIAAAVLTIVFGWCARWSVLLAVADYWAGQETVAGTEKALAFAPGRAAYHVRLSKLLADSDPAGARRALQQALALDSWDAESWIDLGLSYEAGGEYQDAERCLLHAAQLDRQYLPRWTLANYYFRRDDAARFWQWAKSAAEMLYADPEPLYRLCGMVEEDGKLPDRLAIRKPALRAAYLRYLLNQDRLDLISPSVEAVRRNDREADVPLLLSSCDKLLAQSRVDEALAIWNGLASGRRIPYEALDPAAGRSLTNGAFAAVPMAAGFDWRLAETGGVASSHDENPSGLRLTFSGRQPESCAPLAQILPVKGNTPYEVTFRYRTFSVPPESGLRWRVTSGVPGEVLAESASLSADEAAEGKLAFLNPAENRTVRLTLAYTRAPGTVRIEGSIVLFNVRAGIAAAAAR